MTDTTRPVMLSSAELANVFDRRAGELQLALDMLLGPGGIALSPTTAAQQAICAEYRLIAYYLRVQPFGPVPRRRIRA